MSNLGTALSDEIDRVRALQDEYKSARGIPGALVEPQIAMMERDLQAATQAQDVIQMLQAYETLKGWTG